MMMMIFHFFFFSPIRGLHLNIFTTSLFNSPFAYLQAKLFFPEKEQKKIFPIKNFFGKVLAESGYFHLQGTCTCLLEWQATFTFSILLGRVVRKLNNANPRLDCNQGF